MLAKGAYLFCPVKVLYGKKNKAEVLLLDFSLFCYFIATDKTLVMWLKCVF